MDDINERIATWVRASRRAACISQEELGVRLERELGETRGYTKANISGWENRKHRPNLKQLLAITRVTGAVLPQDLLDAAGIPAPPTGSSADEEAARPVVNVSRIVADEVPSTVPVARLNVKLRAGITRSDAEYDESFGDDFQLPTEALASLRTDPANLRAFQIKGASGEPLFFEDDIAIVDVSQTQLINRELFAVIFDGEPCVKQMLHRGGQWYLHSMNPDFGPVNVRSGEFRMIGRVVYQPGRLLTGRL